MIGAGSPDGGHSQAPFILTVIHQEAKFLNHRQVPRHPVDAVSLQACKHATQQLLFLLGKILPGVSVYRFEHL